MPWLMTKIWDFRIVRMVKFGFLPLYVTHIKLPILKLIFYSRNT